jgi:hypothetical protein
LRNLAEPRISLCTHPTLTVSSSLQGWTRDDQELRIYTVAGEFVMTKEGLIAHEVGGRGAARCEPAMHVHVCVCMCQRPVADPPVPHTAAVVERVWSQVL